jgi:hypothetical protein
MYEILPYRSWLLKPNPRRLKEDPTQPHWYDSVFNNEVVQSFVQRSASEPASGFIEGCNINGMITLTVAIPAESGTLCGLRIEKLSIPGRYEYPDIGNLLVSSNIEEFL